ncbi:MAG: insulinase family protein, partial [Pseudomonadota bacterium]
KLDIPNATSEKLDETFKLLSGMVTAPIFTDHGVKTEVPIVLAEMRERTSPQSRVLDQTRDLFFKNQLLASRERLLVKAFHDKWYRPDNTVIVVAGDADPAALVARIEQWFGGWKVAGKKPVQPDFGKPVAPAGLDPKNPVGEAKVLVDAAPFRVHQGKELSYNTLVDADAAWALLCDLPAELPGCVI